MLRSLRRIAGQNIPIWELRSRRLGRHDEAEAAYRTAIALDPKFAPAHHNLGNLLHSNRDAMPKLKQQFRAALAFRRDYANAWNGLGHSLQCQGRLR